MKIKTVLFVVSGVFTFQTFAADLREASVSSSKVISIDVEPSINQDRSEIAFNNMMNELARVHREVFALPYDYEYIKGTLMVQIEKKRLEIAPHYPSREVTGTDQSKVMSEFKSWYENYPQEFIDYVNYVEQFIQKHKK